MVKTLLIISLVLMIGAASVTAAAAQAGQPGDPINAVKVWSDQVHTVIQTRAQVQLAQTTGRSGAELGQQERDRLRLQVQDLQQTQERDRVHSQTHDMQQTQERIQQSQNSGQPGQAGGNPWVNAVPTSGKGDGPKLGQGIKDTCLPLSQNCNGGQPNPDYGNRP